VTFRDLADIATAAPNLERSLATAYTYLGGIPGRELGLALRAGEGLSVVYQPQVNVDDGHVPAVEALVRWRHPKVGAVSPRVFIPISEDTGLILQITEFVLREACALANRNPNLTVAVNLSPMLFVHPLMIQRFADIVAQCGANPYQIEFEITESLPFSSNGSARESIAMLRGSGFRIALDDYGIGYSGPRRLRYISVDKLKIDQSFVRGLDQANASPSQRAVREMIDLGRNMNLLITAEGVETETQRQFLESAGCHALQGYIFAPPMGAQDLETFLANRNWIVTAARAKAASVPQYATSGYENSIYGWV
jgi:EAL domain-containing protein (putative c-di-GMP-specific phosphodiesterase class I)